MDVFLWFPAKEKNKSWSYMSMMATPYWQNPSRTEQERIIESFSSYGKKLTASGLEPKLMRLDNEASQLLKSYVRDRDINFQMLPPYSHRINTAEREIR
jgi:hypothetical protein